MTLLLLPLEDYFSFSSSYKVFTKGFDSLLKILALPFWGTVEILNKLTDFCCPSNIFFFSPPSIF